MELSVLLLLALPALSSANLYSCGKDDRPVLLLDPSLENIVPNITTDRSTNKDLPTPPEIEEKLTHLSLFKFDQTNLEWKTFDGSLPDGAVSIYNGYVGRTDYVCQFWYNTGFYNPDKGSYCHYPYEGVAYIGTPFQILVNKDNFEFLEWKEDSYGSVPQNSIHTNNDHDVYVGKNKYGLGKVHTRNKAFFLPWEGSEYWYNYYQVLTFNKDIYSEHLSEVKYKTDGIEPVKYPPETMRNSAITNYECRPVTGTATLSKANQVQQSWGTSFSITMGVKTSITAGIPLIGETGIEFSASTTLQFTKGTTYTETTTHTVSVQHIVPPNHTCKVTMVGYKYSADIPYTARISRTYSNGETRWTSITGTYSSIQMGEVRAVVDRCEPVPDPTPCP